MSMGDDVKMGEASKVDVWARMIISRLIRKKS